MATTDTTALADVIKTAYDRLAYTPLRAEPAFDAVADVRPQLLTQPGTTLTWTIFNDLTAVTTAAGESSDPTPVALADTTVSVTLNEYLNGLRLTAKARATSFVDVDAVAMNIVLYNMVDSIDQVAANQIVAGTNVKYANGQAARVNLQANRDTISMTEVRQVVTILRANKAQPRKQNYYLMYIHPYASYDFRAATGAGSWQDVHKYAAPQSIFAGEIGAVESVIAIETPRAPIFAGLGSGSPSGSNVYATMVLGQQAFAKAVAIEPHIVLSPVTDMARRFPGIAWYAFLGYTLFRNAAAYRIESATAHPQG